MASFTTMRAFLRPAPVWRLAASSNLRLVQCWTRRALVSQQSQQRQRQRRHQSTASSTTTSPTTATTSDSTTSPRTAASTSPAASSDDVKPANGWVVSRTPSNNLPIYHMLRRSKTLRLTEIKRIEGDRRAMRRALIDELEFPSDEVNISNITGKILIRGWHYARIGDWLSKKGF